MRRSVVVVVIFFFLSHAYLFFLFLSWAPLVYGRTRMDYLRPYSLAHPVQSFTVLSEDPEPQYGYEDSPPTPEGKEVLFESRLDCCTCFIYRGRVWISVVCLVLDARGFVGVGVCLVGLVCCPPEVFVWVCRARGGRVYDLP